MSVTVEKTGKKALKFTFSGLVSRIADQPKVASDEHTKIPRGAEVSVTFSSDIVADATLVGMVSALADRVKRRKGSWGTIEGIEFLSQEQVRDSISKILAGN